MKKALHRYTYCGHPQGQKSELVMPLTRYSSMVISTTTAMEGQQLHNFSAPAPDVDYIPLIHTECLPDFARMLCPQADAAMSGMIQI